MKRLFFNLAVLLTAAFSALASIVMLGTAAILGQRVQAWRKKREERE